MVNSEEEAKLVLSAQAGNAQAFALLYDRYVNKVYRHVYYRVGNQADTEDITQQVFIEAYQALGKYRNKGCAFISWLLTIAQHLVIDFYRTRKQSKSLEEGSLPASRFEQPEIVLADKLNQERIRRGISALEPVQQQVVIMRMIDDLSFREIAAAMDKSEGAVRVILHRGLARLRRELKGEL